MSNHAPQPQPPAHTQHWTSHSTTVQYLPDQAVMRATTYVVHREGAVGVERTYVHTMRVIGPQSVAITTEGGEREGAYTQPHGLYPQDTDAIHPCVLLVMFLPELKKVIAESLDSVISNAFIDYVMREHRAKHVQAR